MRGKTRFAPHISHGDWFRTAPSLPAACHATAGRSSCNRPCAGAPSPNSHAPPESPADKRDAASPAAFVHHDIELRITGLKTPPRVEFQGSLADNRHHPVSPSQPARPTPTLTISDATLEARANPHDSVTAPQPHPLHARPDAAFGDVVSVRTRRGFHSPGSCPWPPLSALRRETTAQHAPASEADKRVPPTHSAPPNTQPNTGLHPHTNTPSPTMAEPLPGCSGRFQVQRASIMPPNRRSQPPRTGTGTSPTSAGTVDSSRYCIPYCANVWSVHPKTGTPWKLAQPAW